MPKTGLNTKRAFQLASELLKQLGFKFAAHGGQAANTYRPSERQTTDWDFLVVDGDLEDLRVELEALGFSITRYHRPGEQTIGQVRARRDDIAYDFNLISVDYERDAIERAQANDGVLVIEDLLIQKLFAWRDRDRDDVRAILATRPALNMAIFEEWADYFEIRERLDAELRRAGIR